ncbi:MAG: metalloregulator ArsR/SmtB family transcription factor [Candidatus Bathyarchaeia archaeon]
MKKGLSEACYLFFSTLSNPTRLAILELLKNNPMNVTQISKALNQDQSMISHNLKPLIRCCFIFVEKRRKKRIYSLNSETMDSLFKLVEGHKDKYCRNQKCRSPEV